MQGCRYEEAPVTRGKKVFCLDLQYLSHDGEQFGWGAEHAHIKQFDGGRKVPSLSMVPLERLPEKDAVCAALKARGKA